MIASSTEKIKSARTLAFEALYEIFENDNSAFLLIKENDEIKALFDKVVYRLFSRHQEDG